MKRIVLILGMHRSGTSLLAQIVYRLGIYMGEKEDLDFSTNGNKDGHFEHIRIRDIHDEILASLNETWCSIGVDWNSLEASSIAKYKDKLRTEVKKLLYGYDIVAIKDPRMALFLPLWDELIREEGIDPILLYVVRKADEVAASLNKRDAIPIEYGIKLWKSYNVSIQNYLYKKESLTIAFESLFEENSIQRIGEYIGKTENNCDILKVAKNEYRHNNSKELEIKLDEECKRIYECSYSKAELADLLKAQLKYVSNHKKLLMDFRQIVSDINLWKEKEIIIYGAGKTGISVVEKLTGLGITNLRFCDRDPQKVNTIICGIPVIGVSSIENKERVCMIIAIADSNTTDFLIRYFPWLDKISICKYDA